jgi:hypothetical protein
MYLMNFVNVRNMEKETTTITVLKATVERLKNAGRKGDTYDAIIQQLLEAKEK